MSRNTLSELQNRIEGEVFADDLHRIIYATDASVYREIPLGVVYPRSDSDVQAIIQFCNANSISLIPRAGGTSLAGQCVGNGLVVDVSKHMIKVLAIDKKAKQVTVQPGVIRDVLNMDLKSYGLLFGPNTSTANRATLGGMVGNNSCGSTSIVFGNTRDHIVSVEGYLSDGSFAEFKEITNEEFLQLTKQKDRLGEIYAYLYKRLSTEQTRADILKNMPSQKVKRRNTGYAIDELLKSKLFGGDEDNVNVARFICGSEGTLFFATKITVGLNDLPLPHESLVAIHYKDVIHSLRSVPIIMKHRPYACELMDKTILDCTKGQKTFVKDRFFLEGDPQAVMLVSFRGQDEVDNQGRIDQLIDDLRKNHYGYSFPVINDNVERIWNLRKAGLGLLANLPGDEKALACIEDTAVDIDILGDYIEEFTQLMSRYNQKAVYYAHAGDGEIHLRPILDIKTEKGREDFYNISLDTARLVKKYNGSLSGEHGDGRVRAPFIEEVVGKEVYSIFKEIKDCFDPLNIFNPGKIVDVPDMLDDLRYDKEHVERAYDTVFDYAEVGGILRAAEKCNGSGDCRKTERSGGVMCPSYMATRNEKDTTRARANTLREVLTRPKSTNAWNSEELKEVMDLCVSCKGCLSECPSNVDMSSMKSEFLYRYQLENGFSFRSKLFARFDQVSKWLSPIGGLISLVEGTKLIRPIKSLVGIHPDRSLPKIASNTLIKRVKKLKPSKRKAISNEEVYLFIDEFTNYNDPEIGEKGILLLKALGIEVKVIKDKPSGRAAISKGHLDLAKKYAEENVKVYSKVISKGIPLIGIEHSAILTFRDEYPRIVSKALQESAIKLSSHCYTIEEYLYQLIKEGVINENHFTKDKKQILLHGHCHTKALSSQEEIAWILSLPKNYSVDIIPSGCCGMAGSFGFEEEHFDVSNQIAELVLFPAIEKADKATIIVANGTSCRHQIKDGLNQKSFHPIEVLYDALIK